MPTTEVNTLDEEQLFGSEFVEEMNQRLGSVALSHQIEVNEQPSYANKINVAVNTNVAKSTFKQPNVSAFKTDKSDKSAAVLPTTTEVNDTSFADGYLDEMLAFKQANYSDKFEVQAREEARAIQEEFDDHMIIELMDKDRAERVKAEDKKRRNKGRFTHTDLY